MTRMSQAAAPRRRRSQEERSRTTRAALIDAAVQCVRRSGYAATRLNDVAAAAGPTKGALQHHFADKRDLMFRVVELGWRDLIERLRGISAIEGSLSARVSAVIDRMWESYSSPTCQAAFEINHAGRKDVVLRERQDPLYREVRATLDREWRRVFADAPVSAERVRMSRRLARSLLHGILMQLQVDPDPKDVSADIALLKETVHWTLTATPPDSSPSA